MEKNLTNIIIIVLTAAIAGAATPYSILAVMDDNPFEGWSADIFTLIGCALTAGLAIIAILLIFLQGNIKIAFILTMAVPLIWALLLVYYFLRPDREESIWKVFSDAKLFRKLDVVRALYYISLSGSAIVVHVLNGSLNT